MLYLYGYVRIDRSSKTPVNDDYEKQNRAPSEKKEVGSVGYSGGPHYIYIKLFLSPKKSDANMAKC